MRRRFLSLFSGCGGFDLGFIRSGFQCIGAFDLDPIAVLTHNRNLGAGALVHDLSAGALPYQLWNQEIDVMLAGSPCQGFSTAGKRDINDPRNNLLVVSAKIARRTRPKIFIAENVSGVIAGDHRHYWNTAKGLLVESGYQFAEFRLDAEAHGLAQKRKRMLLIAWRTGTHCNLRFQNNGFRRNLADVLAGIKPSDSHAPKMLTGKQLMIANRIQQGQKLCNVREGPRAIHTWDIPEVFGSTTAVEKNVLRSLLRIRRRERERSCGDADPVRLSNLLEESNAAVNTVESLERKGFIRKIGRRYDLTNTFNGKYRRLESCKAALTVDTRFGEPRYFLHPIEHRGFTVREAARIQGFPDEFEFDGSERDRFRLIGNAVPPPMAKVVAQMVNEAFFS